MNSRASKIQTNLSSQGFFDLISVHAGDKCVQIFKTQSPLVLDAVKEQALSFASRYAREHQDARVYLVAEKHDKEKRRSSYF